MTRYYLKLYHETLDDWKVLSLSDGLKWRFIQCLLVAGELDQNGWLPELRQFAARIRPMAPDALQADLARLAAVELVELRIDMDDCERWFIPKFERRQARSANAKYQADWREREKEKKEAKKREDKIEDKIRLDTRNITSKILTSNITSKNDDGFGIVVTSYENNIALITPIISEEIQAATDEFGADDVIEAIGLAVKADVRKWSYVNGILKSWRKNGKQDRRQSNGDQQSKPQQAEQLIKLIGKYGRPHYQQAKPELESAGFLPVIKTMGGWARLCELRPEQIKFAYYAAVKT